MFGNIGHKNFPQVVHMSDPQPIKGRKELPVGFLEDLKMVVLA